MNNGYHHHHHYNNGTGHNGHEEATTSKRRVSSTSSAAIGAEQNGTLLRHESREYDNELIVKEREKEISKAYASIIDAIGEDPTRQGLLKTPQRAAKAILHFTKGYEENLDGWFAIHFYIS